MIQGLLRALECLRPEGTLVAAFALAAADTVAQQDVAGVAAAAARVVELDSYSHSHTLQGCTSAAREPRIPDLQHTDPRELPYYLRHSHLAGLLRNPGWIQGVS